MAVRDCGGSLVKRVSVRWLCADDLWRVVAIGFAEAQQGGSIQDPIAAMGMAPTKPSVPSRVGLPRQTIMRPSK